MGLFESDTKLLEKLVLGDGVPKNFNLQPEPARGQVLGLPNVAGYHFDVQIVSSPVTDSSLSSCFPPEAVTWGKVDRHVYQQTTESMQADYSIVLPFLVKALLDNRARYERLRDELGEEHLLANHPQAEGYLRPRDGYRVYDKRDALTETLRLAVKDNKEWIAETLDYRLA